VINISPFYQADDRPCLRYSVEKVATSRDDYYVGRGEVAGPGLGHGVAALDLSGIVDADDYLTVMDGRYPVDSRRLVDRQGEHRVCGWSLTFSTPKSLSLLWAFGGHRVADAVRSAHDRARLIRRRRAWLKGDAAA
jgi:conjugative relaxase-like TrwC/TraI family protein